MLKEKWVVVNGSIITEKTYKVKTEHDTTFIAPKYIAFNVGNKMAEHIVKLHNDSLGIV